MSSMALANSEPRSASYIQELPPDQALMKLLMGGVIVPMIGAAAELGMIAALASGAKDSASVALACGTPQDATHRLLRGLFSVGILHEHADGRFSLSPMGECLRPGVPGSFDALARMNGAAWCGGVYLGLADAIRTGQSAFSRHHGTDIFTWLSRNPAECELFGKAMSTFTGVEIELVLGAYDFSEASHVVDVGGGHGLLLSRILEAVPSASGTLFDLPEVVEHSARNPPSALQGRCRFEGGDFFERMPRGGDLYILKHILHDWDDARAESILRRVGDVLPPGGRVLIIEQGIAPAGIASPGKLMDVVMMALGEGGRERSRDEHAALLERVGLAFHEEIATRGPITVFVGGR